jgi:signal transduction histidine kinase/ActR/RegA family two-component response regulator
MDRSRRIAPAMSLYRVATVIFAGAVVLPNLLLAYLLMRAGLLGRGEARLGLIVAVVMGALGLFALRGVVGRIGRLARDLQAPAGVGEAAGPVAAGLLLIPEVTEITEIAQIGSAFRRMIEDLRSATERLEDLVFKLGTLNETVELAAHVPRIQDLLGLVLTNTMRAVRATIGSIMMLDPERQTLRLVASRGLPGDASSAVEVRVGEGIAGRVLELGEPVLVEDIATDPRFGRPSAPHYGNGSFICMPIRAGDRTIGVLNMAKERKAGPGASSVPQPFTALELQFLNTLMTYIGYSVDNARLLEEARRSAQNLQDVVDDLKTSQAVAVRNETLRAIGQLSSGVAHHLNNLFAVILGRTELLQRKVGDPEILRALEIVRQAGQDGAEVVRRVQRFSRVEALAQPVAVDLNQIAADVVELTRPRWYDEAQLQGVRIEVGVDGGSVPPALGDPAPLREALMNLVLNAIDAMPRGGRIIIKSWFDGDRVCCAVTDGGVGMPEAVRRRALEPFFTTKGPQSLGLGLSAAYGTVRRHGGTLTLESAEGQGTTATFSLPVAAPVPAAPATPLAASPPLRILVIDDDARVRGTLADLLSTRGHAVVQASSGQEGLAHLGGVDSVDLVITDLGMPDMTGWEVARTVRERWPGLPVGLITGWGDQDLQAAERKQVDFVISKPFEEARLHEALSSLFDRASPRPVA